MSNPILVTEAIAFVGMKVVRGKDWCYGSQDTQNGGDGIGVIIGLNPGSTHSVSVKWTSGDTNTYRIADSYDLYLYKEEIVTFAIGDVVKLVKEGPYTKDDNLKVGLKYKIKSTTTARIGVHMLLTGNGALSHLWVNSSLFEKSSYHKIGQKYTWGSFIPKVGDKVVRVYGYCDEMNEGDYKTVVSVDDSYIYTSSRSNGHSYANVAPIEEIDPDLLKKDCTPVADPYPIEDDKPTVKQFVKGDRVKCINACRADLKLGQSYTVVDNYTSSIGLFYISVNHQSYTSDLIRSSCFEKSLYHPFYTRYNWGVLPEPGDVVVRVNEGGHGGLHIGDYATIDEVRSRNDIRINGYGHTLSHLAPISEVDPTLLRRDLTSKKSADPKFHDIDKAYYWGLEKPGIGDCVIRLVGSTALFDKGKAYKVTRSPTHNPHGTTIGVNLIDNNGNEQLADLMQFAPYHKIPPPDIKGFGPSTFKKGYDTKQVSQLDTNKNQTNERTNTGTSVQVRKQSATVERGERQEGSVISGSQSKASVRIGYLKD